MWRRPVNTKYRQRLTHENHMCCLCIFWSEPFISYKGHYHWYLKMFSYPVSYTHLDVYKRQISIFALSGLSELLFLMSVCVSVCVCVRLCFILLNFSSIIASNIMMCLLLIFYCSGINLLYLWFLHIQRFSKMAFWHLRQKTKRFFNILLLI